MYVAQIKADYIVAFSYIFLTYEIEFVLFLAVLINSVLFMDWASSHATLNVTSELLISEATLFLHHHETNRMTFWKGRYAN